MQSDPVLDFDPLLAPISDDRPTGVYVREDENDSAIYFDIKSYREDARTAEEYVPGGDDEGVEEQPPNPVDKWNRLLDKCVSVLEGKTKDLEFAAYLTEALVRVKQAAGLRDGLRLMREYVERYWSDLNPPPDMEERDPSAQMERRIVPLSNLNTGTLAQALDGLYLTDPDGGEATRTFFDYHTAHAAAYPKTGKAPNLEKMQELRRQVNNGPPDHVRRLAADLAAAQEELLALDKAVVAAAGDDAPSLSKIREKLEANQRILKDLAGDRLRSDDEPGSDEGGPAADGDGQASSGGGGFAAGPVRGREDALRTLLEIAGFFKRTEPHSPVSYHVEEAVRWGRMSLPELLKELIPEGTRGGVLQRIGIPDESPPPSE